MKPSQNNGQKLTDKEKIMPMQPNKSVRGPVGFKKIKDKATAKQAAAEWVNSTTSGNVKKDIKAFDTLMNKAGFPNTKNPFEKYLTPGSNKYAPVKPKNDPNSAVHKKLFAEEIKKRNKNKLNSKK